jgi:hypothetical protein
VHWKPEADPAVVILCAPPDGISLKIRHGRFPDMTMTEAPEGVHLLCDPGGPGRLHILRMAPDSAASMALIPLDADGFARLESIYRLLSLLHGRKVPPDRRLTPQRLRRAQIMLRAHDGRAAGATHREIAQVLFNIPPMRRDEWQTASERYAVMGLLRDARAMVAGGYLGLLRPRR